MADDDGAGDDDSLDDAALASEPWGATEGYEGWPVPDGWEGIFLSASHMGAYVSVFHDAALDGWDGSGSAPDGAVAVKENSMDEAGASFDEYTVMYEVAGYDPDNGDWSWAEFGQAGEVLGSGRIGMCTGCHVSAATDSVWTKTPPAE